MKKHPVLGPVYRVVSGKLVTYDMKKAASTSCYDYMIRPTGSKDLWRSVRTDNIFFSPKDAIAAAVKEAKNDMDHYRRLSDSYRDKIKEIKAIKLPKEKK